MAIDQAEDIRRRLEARQTGQPFIPPEPIPDPPQPAFQPPAPPVSREPPRKPETSPTAINSPQPVVIVDVKIKFWSLVILMVKGAFAFIPAGIIIAIISSLLFAVMTGFLHKGP